MAGLDASIIMGGRPVQIQNPLEAQEQVYKLRDLAQQGQMRDMAIQDRARGLAEQNTLAQIYRGAVLPNGKPNHEAIIQSMANNGLGHLIPGYRKTMLDADKDAADIASKTQTTETGAYDLKKKKLDHSSAVLGSLLADPDVTHDKIITAITQQVQNGMMDPQQGAQLVGQIPGNPERLRGFLTQKSLEVADAKTRLEMTTPKFQHFDSGGKIIMGGVNPLTAQFTPNADMQKSVTPGEALQSATSIQTTGMNNRQSGRNTDVMAGVQALHAEQTPTGMVVVDKRNPGAGVQPIMLNGSQVQQKDSPLWKATQGTLKLDEAIGEARKLLPGATGSGVGALVDKGLALGGMATPGADVAGQLEALGGWMVSNVPRMEGPQSDKDVAVYTKMAAQVGDRTVPVSVRLKALDTLEGLQKKYSAIATTPVNSRPPKARPPLSAFGGN